MATFTISSYDDARLTYRIKDLRQALYDAGEVIMEDVIVNLHADEHRARRRIENRLYRRDTFFHYERELFPSIIEDTVGPYVEEGRAELVSLGHQLMMNLAALTAGVDRPDGTPEETFRLYDYLRVFIEGATLANHNHHQQVVVSGPTAAIEKLEANLLADGIEAKRLKVATAFHSPVVADSVEPFTAFLGDIPFQPVSVPCYHNLSLIHISEPTRPY